MNSRISGIFLAVVFLALGAVVVAQRGPGERPSREEGRGLRADVPFLRGPGIGDLSRLTEALDLNASQVSSIEGLLESRRADSAAIREQFIASREQLEALIESGDALAVGNAVLAQHELREQLGAINAQLMTDFRNVLTPAQEETFDSIRSMVAGGTDGDFRRRGPRGPRGRGL